MEVIEKTVKYLGWQVRSVPDYNYKPDPEWEPFAVTGRGTIWLRHSLIEFRAVNTKEQQNADI